MGVGSFSGRSGIDLRVLSSVLVGALEDWTVVLFKPVCFCFVFDASVSVPEYLGAVPN
jgi:hypothetical protein